MLAVYKIEDRIIVKVSQITGRQNAYNAET